MPPNDAENFRLSAPEDPFSFRGALQQIKDMGNPVIMSRKKGLSDEAAQEVALDLVTGLGGLAGTFIGAKGAKMMNSQGVPHLSESQDLARRLQEQGLPDSKIWAMTGRETGYPTTTAFPDGKIMTEVSDVDVPFRLPLHTENVGQFGEEFSHQGIPWDFLPHQSVATAYPHFDSDVLQIVRPGVWEDSMLGSRSGGLTQLNGAPLLQPKGGRNLRSTLLHEGQHAIDDFEGATTGANYSQIASKLQQVAEPTLTANVMLELHRESMRTGVPIEKVIEAWFEGGGIYRNHMGRVAPTHKMIRDPDYRQMQVELYKRNGPSFFKEMLDTHTIPQVMQAGGWDPYLGYRSTAGEVKARLVQQRADLPQSYLTEVYPFSKDGTYPHHTVDTPLEKQFIRERGTGNAVAGPPVSVSVPGANIVRYKKDWVHKNDIPLKDPNPEGFAEGGLVEDLIGGLTEEQAHDIMIALHTDAPQKFANGGLVGNNPFTAQTKGLFGQMDLIHPKNSGAMPLDIGSVNDNNVLAQARANTPQAQHYTTR